ncbi:MAG: hypothetical protein HY881_16715 [Deltaproteobacteria bacterium]|nr:hypothetical protein [Deltaproteobacteria bacterium]
MKKTIRVGMVLMVFVLGLAFAAFAGHNSMGQMLRNSTVDGYSFMYHVLNMAERNDMMKGMEGMEMPGMSKSPDITNHLMVYISDPGGKPVSGKIGFLITGPDGKEQKTLTMGMHDGYGADVSFKEKGIYKIKTKAVIDGKTLLDEFSHEVK